MIKEIITNKKVNFWLNFICAIMWGINAFITSSNDKIGLYLCIF